MFGNAIFERRQLDENDDVLPEEYLVEVRCASQVLEFFRYGACDTNKACILKYLSNVTEMITFDFPLLLFGRGEGLFSSFSSSFGHAAALLFAGPFDRNPCDLIGWVWTSDGFANGTGLQRALS